MPNSVGAAPGARLKIGYFHRKLLLKKEQEFRRIRGAVVIGRSHSGFAEVEGILKREKKSRAWTEFSSNEVALDCRGKIPVQLEACFNDFVSVYAQIDLGCIDRTRYVLMSTTDNFETMSLRFWSCTRGEEEQFNFLSNWQGIGQIFLMKSGVRSEGRQRQKSKTSNGR